MTSSAMNQSDRRNRSLTVAALNGIGAATVRERLVQLLRNDS